MGMMISSTNNMLKRHLDLMLHTRKEINLESFLFLKIITNFMRM